MSTAEDFHYEGFSGPNGTIVPDDVFDVLAPRLSEAELRVLLYIVRRTFGFGKNADAISLKQLTQGIVARDGRILDHGTGMSRKAVIKGCEGLAQKGIISIERRKRPDGNNHVNIYKLRFREQIGVVTSGDQGSYPTPPSPVTSGNTQESVKQESVRHNNTSVVASYSDTEKQLYEDLKTIGIHHNTAGKLLREYSTDRIQATLTHLLTRLQTGWQPRETPAAWLVAAIRQGYEFTAISLGKDEQSQTDQESQKRQIAHISEATDREFALQRLGILKKHDIDGQSEATWNAVQEQLKRSKEWSPVLAGAFLRLNVDNSADIFAPALLLDRVKRQQGVLSEAIAKICGSLTSLNFRSL